MAEGVITRKGSQQTITIHSFDTDQTTTGSALTVNSGNVGAKKKAVVTGYVVGANTNTPTLTCTFYGSNDGTNFTQIGTALSISKTGTATAGKIDSKEFDATGYTYFRVVTNSISSGLSFGYGVSMSLV